MNGRGGIVATAAVTMTSSPGAAGRSVLEGAFGHLERDDLGEFPQVPGGEQALPLVH